MFKLRVSPAARDDLLEIKDYITLELGSPQAALSFLSRITKRISGLSENPEMGAPLSSVLDIPTDYRFLVCANYLIFYRCEADCVFVSRVIYGRRDYMHILFDLPEDEQPVV